MAATRPLTIIRTRSDWICSRPNQGLPLSRKGGR
jgi:hypothetical protein